LVEVLDVAHGGLRKLEPGRCRRIDIVVESWGMPLMTQKSRRSGSFVAIGRPVGGFTSGEVVEI
jgi:hypothetical protein